MDRIRSIDYVKGIAILSLVVSHCLSGGFLRSWITSFDMPVFFIICGILNTMRNPEGIPFRKFSSWLKHRIKQIFVPYFVFGLLYILFIGMLSFISGGKFILMDELISLFSLKGVASMWFLPVYFFAELLYVFFISKIPNIFQGLLISCIVFFLLYNQVSGQIQVAESYVQLTKVLVSLVFVVLGRYLWVLKEKVFMNFHYIPLIISSFLISLLALYNGFVQIGSLSLGNVIIFYVVASALSVLIMTLLEKIGQWVDSKNKILIFLSLFGMNSIVVLVSNNLLIEIFRLIEYKYFNNIFLNSGTLGGLLMAAILIIPEFCLIQLSQKKIGIIFGKGING